MTLKLGLRLIWRQAYWRSFPSLSRRVQPHMSLVTSWMSSSFPSSFRAFCSAWAGVSPCAIRSSMPWPDAHGALHSALHEAEVFATGSCGFYASVLRGLHQGCDCRACLTPSAVLGGEMLSARRGQAVVFGALFVLGLFPLRLSPSLAAPADAGPDIAIRSRLAGLRRNPTGWLANPITMLCSPAQRLQNQHVQGALNQLDSILVTVAFLGRIGQ